MAPVIPSLSRTCPRLPDFSFTSDTVFDTVPWPQKPKRAENAEVAAAAVALRTLRREVMAAHGWSLRDIYRTLDEPGDNPLRTAHARLDTAVRAAYGMAEGSSTRSSAASPPDALAFLLALNLELAAKEKAGEKITPPGLPVPETGRATFKPKDAKFAMPLAFSPDGTMLAAGLNTGVIQLRRAASPKMEAA